MQVSSLKICEFISIVLSGFVAGMFYGPWLALSRSFGTFEPEILVAIVIRLNRNMAAVMTILMPAALLSIIAVIFVSYHEQPRTFYLSLTAFALFVVALLVTIFVEVPIVQQIETWTVSTLPANWSQLRDRWGAFHIVRIAAGFLGLLLLLTGTIF